MNRKRYKNYSFNKNKILNGLTLLSIVLAPSLLTHTTYTYFYEHNTTSTILSNISTISTSIYYGLEDSQRYASYSLNALLGLKCFETFNIAEMSDYLNQFLYRNPTVSNIYVIDSSYNTVYGTNDTQASDIPHPSHIQTALKGEFACYSDVINQQPFTQFAFPIASNDSSNEIQGVLVITYNFAPIAHEFQTLNDTFSKLDGYLFDEEGRLLACSSKSLLIQTYNSVDIASIRRSIMHDPTSPFTLFDDTPILGSFYVLKESGWTLLITSSIPDSLETFDFNSVWVILSSALSIIFLEYKQPKGPTHSSPNTHSKSSGSSNPPTPPNASSTCSSCPPNTNSSNSCASCPPNTNPSNSCTSCSPNTNPSNSCASYPPNTNSSNSYTSCPPNISPSNSYTSCPPNTNPFKACTSYSPNTNSSKPCTSCPPNTNPSTPCASCSPNTNPSNSCASCSPPSQTTSSDSCSSSPPTHSNSPPPCTSCASGASSSKSTCPTSSSSLSTSCEIHPVASYILPISSYCSCIPSTCNNSCSSCLYCHDAYLSHDSFSTTPSLNDTTCSTSSNQQPPSTSSRIKNESPNPSQNNDSDDVEDNSPINGYQELFLDFLEVLDLPLTHFPY